MLKYSHKVNKGEFEYMNTEVINLTEEKMNKTLDNLEHRFVTVRAGRANPSSLDGITADYYGSPTPLKQLATISVPEARQLLIKPFDRSCLGAIEKAIFESNLGYTPNNDGETIRIIIPVLTEERRKELTKQVRAMAEDAKVSIRNIRHDANEDIEKEEISEDEQKNLQNRVQDLVNKYNKLIDEKTKEKENELMTV
jgi:ribosome recycling factor